jgi:hypothetical protein
MGHSSIAVTLEVYTHALDEMQEEASEKVRGFLFGEDSPEDDASDSQAP